MCSLQGEPFALPPNLGFTIEYVRGLGQCEIGFGCIFLFSVATQQTMLVQLSVTGLPKLRECNEVAGSMAVHLSLLLLWAHSESTSRNTAGKAQPTFALQQL